MSRLYEDGREMITNTLSTNSVFSVFSLRSTLATDTANYTCRARNRLGTNESNPSVVSILSKLLCVHFFYYPCTQASRVM